MIFHDFIFSKLTLRDINFELSILGYSDKINDLNKSLPKKSTLEI